MDAAAALLAGHRGRRLLRRRVHAVRRGAERGACSRRERARRVHRVSRRCGRPLVPWNARRAREQACGGCGSSDRRGGRRHLNAESGLVVVRTQF
ncbi:hypothetical protein ACFPRL_18875 [Pseudoclavibacter helvolus]